MLELTRKGAENSIKSSAFAKVAICLSFLGVMIAACALMVTCSEASSRHATERARLAVTKIDKIELDPTAPSFQPLYAEVTISNEGILPARNIKLVKQCVLVEKELPAGEISCSPTRTPEQLLRGQEDIPTLGAGHDHPFSIGRHHTDILNDKEYSEKLEMLPYGHTFLYAYLTYNDGFNPNRHLEICRFVDNEQEILEVCKSHDTAD
jgi:hypothetical protein